jgi:hypothetical protein
MKRILLYCGLFLLTCATAHAAQTNLIELHRNASAMTNKECLKCHGKVLSEKTATKKVKTMHRLHLESKLATPKKCSQCHHSVDLREGSSAALRKQVDPQICAGCHSGGVKGANVLFAN